MKRLFIPICLSALIMGSCELADNGTGNGLSDDDIINGLKTALSIGADTASRNLSSLNAYYGNPLLKIPLPPEAEAIRNTINGNNTLANISSIVGLDNKFEDVIKSVNRSAEDAATEAAPIFKTAISGLTISQGWDILNGIVPSDAAQKSGDFDSTSATQYLSIKTYNPLTDLYAPKINASLSKDLIGTVSAVDAWNALTTTYNNFLGRSDVKTAIAAANLFGQNINLPSAINTDLGEFSTHKALDGLFLKVGDQEKKIRRNPFEWASDIIQKVFGYIQDNVQ